MITIQKKYHFYAAHRNENLDDKCRNIHGHTYYVTAFFAFPDATDASGVTMLFGDIDKLVDRVIKAYDHALIINTADPLWKYIEDYIFEHKDNLKVVRLKQSTSAENLAERIFRDIVNYTGLPIIELHLQETTSSTIIYKTKLLNS